MEKKHDKATSAAWIAAAILLLVPTLYVGSYFMLLERYHVLPLDPFQSHYYAPTYRVGGQFAVFIYWPINKLDRTTRPGYWSPEADMFGGSGPLPSTVTDK